MADEVVSQVVAKLKADNSDLKAKYKEAKEETKGLRSFIGFSMKDIASTALGFLTGSAVQQGVSWLIGGFKDLVTQGIDYNASMEQINTAFKQLLGNAGAAQSFVKMLKDFSDVTPFQAQPIYDAAQQMLAFGFNAQQVKPYLTAIGDALSDMGKATDANLGGVVTIFGQIHASASVQTQDLKQFTTYGIDAFAILAKQMGVSEDKVREMVTKGLIPGKKAADLLAKGLEQTYGGGMAAQAKTFNGLVSTLKTHLSEALGTLTGPLFKLAEKGLGDLIGWMGSKDVKDFIAKVGTDLAGAFDKAGKFLGTLKDDFLKAFDDKNGQKVKKLKDLAHDLLGKLHDLGTWLKDHLKGALEGVATAAGHLADWFSDMKQHLQDAKQLWHDWGGLIEGVGIIIGTFYTPVLVKMGVEAAIADAKLAKGLIISIYNSGKEALIAGAKFWWDPKSFVAGIGKTGEAAKTNAAKVDALTASEQASGTKAATTAAEQDALALSETAVGDKAAASAAEVDTLAASETAAGEAATAAAGSGGAGAAGGAGLGIWGLAGGLAFLNVAAGSAAEDGLATLIDKMTGLHHQSHNPIQDMKDLWTWVTNLGNASNDTANGGMVNLNFQFQQLTGSTYTWHQQLAAINLFFENNPLMLHLNNLRDSLYDIAYNERSAADRAHELNEQWAKLHVPDLGNWAPENPGYNPGGGGGHPHASGGMVGPNEMLSLINDQGGRGELVHLPSGAMVYTHNQSVAMLQAMQRQQPAVVHNYYESNNYQGITSPREIDQTLTLRSQRRAALYGRR